MSFRSILVVSLCFMTAASASLAQTSEKFGLAQIREISDAEAQALGAQFAPFYNLDKSYSVDAGIVPDAAGDIIGDISSGLVLVDKLITLGKTVWDIIQNNKAAVNMDLQTASILPSGVKGAMDLKGWQPVSKNFQVVLPSSSGTSDIDFVFRVSYWSGGSYQGKGQFISNLTVQASSLKVSWGQKFNVRARIPTDGIVNTSTVDGDPIAGAEILVEWSRDKVFSTTESSAVFFVSGDGKIRDFSSESPATDAHPIGAGLY